jgi:hypothetical protein
MLTTRRGFLLTGVVLFVLVVAIPAIRQVSKNQRDQSRELADILHRTNDAETRVYLACANLNAAGGMAQVSQNCGPLPEAPTATSASSDAPTTASIPISVAAVHRALGSLFRKLQGAYPTGHMLSLVPQCCTDQGSSELPSKRIRAEICRDVLHVPGVRTARWDWVAGEQATRHFERCRA